MAELKADGTYDQITGSYFGTSSTAAANKAAAADSVEEVIVIEDDNVDANATIAAEEQTETVSN